MKNTMATIVLCLFSVLTVKAQQTTWNVKDAPNMIKSLQETPVTNEWMDKLLFLSNTVQTVKSIYPYRAQIVTLYNRLPEAKKQSQKGKEVYAILFPPKVKIGDRMADDKLYDLNGTVHHLADYKGKYLLLDFWSSGCVPCMYAMPELKEFSEKYKDSLVIVSLYLGNNEIERWKELSEEKGISWTNLNDCKGWWGMASRYGVKGIPHFVIISPEGKVLDMWAGYGPQLIKLRIRPFLEPRLEKMTISTLKDGSRKTVAYPVVKSTNVPECVVKEVELTALNTKVQISMEDVPGLSLRLKSRVHLVANGKTYALKGTEGITLDRRFTVPPNGNFCYTLLFEPLPMKTTSFTMQEGTTDKDVQIKDIQLVLP